MKKKLAKTITLMGLSLALVHCSSEGGDDNTDEQTATPAMQTTTPEPATQTPEAESPTPSSQTQDPASAQWGAGLFGTSTWN